MFIYIDLPVTLSLESTSTIIDPPKIYEETSIHIKTLPLSPFSESSLFNLNYLLTILLSASILDIVTYPGAMELLITGEILILTLLSDSPLS